MIEVEEVECTFYHLIQNQAGRPDMISPEHLKFSGSVFTNWLCQIYNHICQVERIPHCFKHGIIIPAYKVTKAETLCSRRAIQRYNSSVLAKVFEIILVQ